MRSILWVAIALASSPMLHAATPYATDARPLTLRLAEGGSRGEWLQPRGAAPRSAVALRHGSDVSDLDGAQVDGAGTVVSRPCDRSPNRLPAPGTRRCDTTSAT